MTATSSSHITSGGLVTLLILAGCTMVVCLVDEKVTVQPDTTTEPTRGVTPEPFACGDATDRCPDICDLCQSLGQPSLDCLSTLNQHLCLANFVGAMGSLQSADRCSWGLVKVSYSNFSLCTEEMSDCLRIPWPNSQVERLFVDVHHEYFRDCPSEELSDPPEAVVFALAMTPICLIPIMVSLVVLKTKNGDGSS